MCVCVCVWCPFLKAKRQRFIGKQINNQTDRQENNTKVVSIGKMSIVNYVVHAPNSLFFFCPGLVKDRHKIRILYIRHFLCLTKIIDKEVEWRTMSKLYL